ncbi:MAG TPA: sigma-70 family RNA polymerase sigma factor [Solirubrobacteraceae bacterium]
MSELTLARAQAGSEEAFRELTDPYRRELQLHCYRIVGSVQDAEDLLQETLLAAWRGLEGFEQRASVRTWLYRIATNRCLNALRDRARRPDPSPRAAPAQLPAPTRLAEPLWIEPYPDVLLEGIADRAPEPAARYELKEAIGLAFVTALQRLPPRQRAVLMLRDVLGFSAQEVAGMLETTTASVNSALLRARVSVQAGGGAGERAPLRHSAAERALVDRFARAFEGGDIDGVVELLSADAWLTMPPEPYEFQGAAAIAEFLRRVPRLELAPYRLVPTRANTQPAFGCYRAEAQTGILRAHGLLVLTLSGERISTLTRFLDGGVLPHFGLPRSLPR